MVFSHFPVVSLSLLTMGGDPFVKYIAWPFLLPFHLPGFFVPCCHAVYEYAQRMAVPVDVRCPRQGRHPRLPVGALATVRGMPGSRDPSKRGSTSPSFDVGEAAALHCHHLRPTAMP